MNHLVTTIVALPDELKGAIALAVLAAVRILLNGRVADSFVTELAAIITTAVLALLQLLLGLIPPQFEAVADAVLKLLVVLLGSVFIVRAYMLAHKHAKAQGFKV